MTHYLNSGQTFCSDENGTDIPCPESGQDAELHPGEAWPEPRFQRDGEIVLDRLTGLTWLANPNEAEFPLNFDESAVELKRLNSTAPGGLEDWRLPNRREMLSLISYNERKPAFPAAHPFEKAPLGWIWTSTQSAMQPGYQWLVHSEGGRMFYGRRDSYALLWPVRGTSDLLPATGREDEPLTGVDWSAKRFRVEDDMVFDDLTGLVWTRNANLAEGVVDWSTAMQTARAIPFSSPDGYGAWGLPTVLELESLVDASRHSPALSEGHPFLDTQEAYWSCTNSSFEHDWAMCLYLHKGAVGVGFKKSVEFHVWAVARP